MSDRKKRGYRKPPTAAELWKAARKRQQGDQS
jgi:hypothetical protein